MRFKGKYAFLSNFFPAPIWGYPSAEHVYQAAKTVVPVERSRIKYTPHAVTAKRMGRTVTLRPEWKDPAFKLATMETIVRKKFTTHPDLSERLCETGDIELVEENWWGDTFWGVCNGVGQNHLGKILMKVRSELHALKGS